MNLINIWSEMVSIGFTGDFCPWERMETAFLEESWKDKLKTVRPFFEKNDFNILDLECPLTTEKTGISKTGPHIKSLPATTSIIHWLNCNLVATANNHFMDYGAKGMRSSHKALNQAGIDWIGSGENLDTASKPHLTTLGGIEFAFVNMTENEWSTTHGDAPGCNPIDPVKALSLIQNLKKKADFVVVVIHGGHEHYELPSPRMKETYRFMIDAGADAVVAHHTHIVSGFEVYRGKPIFYSLGNFCFDWEGLRNGTWNIGMLLRLQFEKGKTPTFEYEFVRQNDEKAGVYLITGKEKEDQEKRLLELNNTIQDDKKLASSFDAYAEKVTSIMLTRIQPYNNSILASLHKRNLAPDILGMKKHRLLKNLIQCESHREVLLYALNKKLNK